MAKTGKNNQIEKMLTSPSLEISAEHKKQAKQFYELALVYGLNQFDSAECDTFKRIAPILAAMDRLRDEYLDIIILYCVLDSRIKRHTKLLDSEGWFFSSDGRHGVQCKPHPLAPLVQSDTGRFKQIAESLGLSPKASKALGSSTKDDDSDGFEF